MAEAQGEKIVFVLQLSRISKIIIFYIQNRTQHPLDPPIRYGISPVIPPDPLVGMFTLQTLDNTPTLTFLL